MMAVMRVLLFALVMAVCVGAGSARAQDAGAVVQAFCMDATNNPHPAAQTFAGRDVATDFSGEIFRCLAGTSMRYTVSGAARECAAGEALWFEGGALSCRAQVAREREDDRALLREFRAGDKVVHLAAEPPRAPVRPRRWTY
jgi:hypothetical protein